MIKIVGIRFKKNGKIYYFDPKELSLKVDDIVIVESNRGIELGYVVIAEKEINPKELSNPLKDVIRLATDEDLQTLEANQKAEKEAFEICRKKIEQHKLPIKLIDVSFAFDVSKIIFYFTADGRIDFRELVKDLASVFRTRIELRQIGVRDEAKIIGGLGTCGRELCCHCVLSEFQPVSIKMAKKQNLSLNLSKISGVCGRLMCCLKYEDFDSDNCPKRKKNKKQNDDDLYNDDQDLDDLILDEE